MSNLVLFLSFPFEINNSTICNLFYGANGLFKDEEEKAVKFII